MQSQKSTFSASQLASFSREFWSPQSDPIRKTRDFLGINSSIFAHFLPPVPPPLHTSFKDDHITINGYFVYRQTLSLEQKSTAFFSL